MDGCFFGFVNDTIALVAAGKKVREFAVIGKRFSAFFRLLIRRIKHILNTTKLCT